MKTALAVLLLALLAMAGCKKDTDYTAAWVGTYTGTGYNGRGNTFNQLVIEKSNNFTMRISADTLLPTGAIYTYSVLQQVTVQNSTACSFNENDSVLGFTHPFQMVGSANLSGNTITFTGYGTNAYDTIGYYFYGTKQ